LIDKENKKVAVRKCENDENGYRIQRHPCGTQARISVRNFLKVIGSKNRARIPATITGDLIVFSVEE
jgi:hypothetical protein